MRRIYKYPLLSGNNDVVMPKGAVVVGVGMSEGAPCVWCDVETNDLNETRKFYVYGTGMDIADEVGNHIGLIFDRVFVWHVFEGKTNE